MVFTAHDGEMGVLPGHAPMMVELGLGLLRFRDAADHSCVVFINGGFCHVSDEKVTLLTTEAVTRREITPADAKMILLEAESMPETTAGERRLHHRALQRARLLLKLAEMTD